MLFNDTVSTAEIILVSSETRMNMRSEPKRMKE